MDGAEPRAFGAGDRDNLQWQLRCADAQDGVFKHGPQPASMHCDQTRDHRVNDYLSPLRDPYVDCEGVIPPLYSQAARRRALGWELLVLGFNLLSDGLHDAAGPKLRRSRH